MFFECKGYSQAMPAAATESLRSVLCKWAKLGLTFGVLHFWIFFVCFVVKSLQG